MNFYKHYLGDFERDTGHLSLMERGAYLSLLHHAYATEKPLPSSLDALCRIARAHTKQEREAVKSVLSFFNETPDGYVQNRVLRELEKAQHLRDNSQRVGAKGGRPKKPSGFQNENPVGFENKSPPDTRHHITPLPPSSGDLPLPDDDPEPTPKPTAPPAASPRRGTRLPEGWEPDEQGWQFAMEALSGEQAAHRQLEKFRDWWAAKAGAGGVKLDWHATWRNWIRTEAERHGKTQQRGQQGGRKLSLIERVNPDAIGWWDRQCAIAAAGEILAADDGTVRPPLDVTGR